ncbi:phosphate-starvation-inducible E [Vibrio astriarenae]|uniref:Protein PsiE n=1 Tax=Vibrio astriarenae TaxID=1481923 RepID=A0A7Z2T7G2_9VIBR|nr:phosphate-starvation-inducible PsiE family protein [Vibrio astriarenae]QIA65682.1 phosphate-starvation-inducible E [Vibrio astriarenae]
MGSSLPKRFTRIFLRIYHTIEAILLVAITLATVFAIVHEFHHVFTTKMVLLTDILLMFIYLEVLSMIHQFVVHGKIPVRYPIYIAIMAIARYITLGMKELDGVFVVWLSLAALILALATLVVRFGHHYWPYKATNRGFASLLNDEQRDKHSTKDEH